MKGKKKAFSGIDAIILFSIVFFACFIFVKICFDQFFLFIGKIFSLGVAAVFAKDPQGATETINHEYLMRSLFNLGYFLVYLVFIVFTLIYACKDKMGLPSIIFGLVFGVIWIIDAVHFYEADTQWNFLYLFPIFAFVALVVCVGFGIKKYINLKIENRNKSKLSAENA